MEQLLLEMIDYFQGDAKRVQHLIKVYEFARLIGREEGLESERQEILEAAALVHDIGIHRAEQKFGSSSGRLQEQEGPALAEAMLTRLGFCSSLIQRVCFLVGHHHTYSAIDGLDFQILAEADCLVNFYEDQVSYEGILAAMEKVFHTKTGKKICRTMFLQPVRQED